ncbi:MAG: DUF4440 domain-containing protein [Acidobacteriota bacterium]|nr:DUF4440 domain-containing protein [Acidobacteriota bacterium]
MGTAQTPATADPANPLHTASRQELDVVKVLLAQEDAWNRGDLDAFAASYKNSPDTLFVTNQINHGFAGLLEEYRKEYPSKAAMGTLSFAEIEVHTLDDRFAVCVGRYALERAKKFGGDAQGLFSLVLEKTSTGWKIVLDHST